MASEVEFRCSPIPLSDLPVFTNDADLLEKR